jgi:hypothetical protein
MAKSAAISVRIPAALKKNLAARARAQHRSLSGQIAYELELASGSTDAVSGGGRFVGMFEGTRLPSDAEIEEGRRLLWGRLAKRRRG